MNKILPWFLWLWIAVVIWAAFFYAPLAEGFVGQSSRILFFHVPMAWVSFVAFAVAGVWSIRFLAGARSLAHDRAAHVAVQLGLLFCVLATVTGALWARVMWGAYWNWDPKEVWTFVIWAVYAAYLHARATTGVSRRAATWIAVAGFACIIINYAVVNMWFVGQHSYSGIS